MKIQIYVLALCFVYDQSVHCNTDTKCPQRCGKWKHLFYECLYCMCLYVCVCVGEIERERVCVYLGTKFQNGCILCSSTSQLRSVDSHVESDYSSSWKESTESRNVSTNLVEVVPTTCVSKCVCVCECVISIPKRTSL